MYSAIAMCLLHFAHGPQSGFLGDYGDTMAVMRLTALYSEVPDSCGRMPHLSHFPGTKHTGLRYNQVIMLRAYAITESMAAALGHTPGFGGAGETLKPRNPLPSRGGPGTHGPEVHSKSEWLSAASGGRKKHAQRTFVPHHDEDGPRHGQVSFMPASSSHLEGSMVEPVGGGYKKATLGVAVPGPFTPLTPTAAWELKWKTAMKRSGFALSHVAGDIPTATVTAKRDGGVSGLHALLLNSLSVAGSLPLPLPSNGALQEPLPVGSPGRVEAADLEAPSLEGGGGGDSQELQMDSLHMDSISSQLNVMSMQDSLCARHAVLLLSRLPSFPPLAGPPPASDADAKRHRAYYQALHRLLVAAGMAAGDLEHSTAGTPPGPEQVSISGPSRPYTRPWAGDPALPKESPTETVAFSSLHSPLTRVYSASFRYPDHGDNDGPGLQRVPSALTLPRLEAHLLYGIGTSDEGSHDASPTTDSHPLLSSTTGTAVLNPAASRGASALSARAHIHAGRMGYVAPPGSLVPGGGSTEELGLGVEGRVYKVDSGRALSSRHYRRRQPKLGEPVLVSIMSEALREGSQAYYVEDIVTSIQDVTDDGFIELRPFHGMQLYPFHGELIVQPRSLAWHHEGYWKHASCQMGVDQQGPWLRGPPDPKGSTTATAAATVSPLNSTITDNTRQDAVFEAAAHATLRAMQGPELPRSSSVSLFRSSQGMTKLGLPRTTGVPNSNIPIHVLRAAVAAADAVSGSNISKPLHAYTLNDTWDSSFVIAPPALVASQNVVAAQTGKIAGPTGAYSPRPEVSLRLNECRPSLFCPLCLHLLVSLTFLFPLRLFPHGISLPGFEGGWSPLELTPFTVAPSRGGASRASGAPGATATAAGMDGGIRSRHLSQLSSGSVVGLRSEKVGVATMQRTLLAAEDGHVGARAVYRDDAVCEGLQQRQVRRDRRAAP